ncbi:MAG TPA: plastocyanin/azurin family copper-binding protein [Gemmatimonadales bacterium]|nr:plastocyanin/azurin family copper-binding protein [Gemmatimonadales bacterium]
MPQRLSSRLWPLALLLAAGCGSNSSTGPSSPPDQVGDINIVQGAEFLTTQAFDPNPKTVSMTDGGGIRWVNGDHTTHQMMSDNGAFPTSGLIRAGDTYSITLGTAGTYHYHCAIHPNMVGTITVTP